MKKSSLFAATFAAGALAMGSLGVLAPAASATSSSSSSQTMNGTTHCDPSSPPSFDNPACGQNPILTGPPPPFVTIPSSCPAFLSTDTWVLAFTGGNSVSHGTINKNGDWGGGTANGPATLSTSDRTAQYSGHVTEWFGGGQNSNPGGDPTQQSEFGFTLHFNGSGLAGNLDIHVDQHQTTNNAGTPTSNVINVSVTCA